MSPKLAPAHLAGCWICARVRTGEARRMPRALQRTRDPAFRENRRPKTPEHEMPKFRVSQELWDDGLQSKRAEGNSPAAAFSIPARGLFRLGAVRGGNKARSREVQFPGVAEIHSLPVAGIGLKSASRRPVGALLLWGGVGDRPRHPPGAREPCRRPLGRRGPDARLSRSGRPGPYGVAAALLWRKRAQGPNSGGRGGAAPDPL